MHVCIVLCLIELNVQSNSFIEGVSQKTRRQIDELERVSRVESNALTVDGVPVDSCLTRSVYLFSENSVWIFGIWVLVVLVIFSGCILAL